jgi:hypothetical protein
MGQQVEQEEVGFHPIARVKQRVARGSTMGG